MAVNTVMIRVPMQGDSRMENITGHGRFRKIAKLA